MAIAPASAAPARSARPGRRRKRACWSLGSIWRPRRRIGLAHHGRPLDLEQERHAGRGRTRWRRSRASASAGARTMSGRYARRSSSCSRSRRVAPAYGAVVLTATDPRPQAEAVAVVDQRADHPGVVLLARGSAPPRCAAAPSRRPMHRQPGRRAPAPRPARPARGRARRCGPGSPARPAARPWTGWRRSPTRPDPPAAPRPAPGRRSHHRGDPASPMRISERMVVARTAPRAAGWPAGAAPPAPGAHRPAGSSSPSLLRAGPGCREPPQQPDVLQLQHHRRARPASGRPARRDAAAAPHRRRSIASASSG